jgi:hypothetical protein
MPLRELRDLDARAEFFSVVFFLRRFWERKNPGNRPGL